MVKGNKEWPLYQFDFKNALQMVRFGKEIYMDAHPDFSEGFTKNEGCQKALYGFKQSPKAWF